MCLLLIWYKSKVSFISFRKIWISHFNFCKVISYGCSLKVWKSFNCNESLSSTKKTCHIKKKGQAKATMEKVIFSNLTFCGWAFLTARAAKSLSDADLLFSNAGPESEMQPFSAVNLIFKLSSLNWKRFKTALIHLLISFGNFFIIF